MFEDAAPPRRARGQAVADLAREDLDLYAVEELQERIDSLKAEIARVEAAMHKKLSGRAAADALFGGGER
ncbi:MAG: DUF1192 domain-containing protein [Pseudomonadota bacterium]|nr:DUF1192 domain-containing protein [Pseudomonadota bacterium]